jgi:hypothetical protein
MFGGLQEGRVAHLDIVVASKVPVHTGAARQYRHEPDVHALLQGFVVQYNLHFEADPSLGQPDMVDLVQDILELRRVALACSEVNTERDAIDRARRRRRGRGSVDVDRGPLRLGRVCYSGYTIQREQHKNDRRQERGVFQDCLKLILMLTVPPNNDHGISA